MHLFQVRVIIMNKKGLNKEIYNEGGGDNYTKEK